MKKCLPMLAILLLAIFYSIQGAYSRDLAPDFYKNSKVLGSAAADKAPDGTSVSAGGFADFGPGDNCAESQPRPISGNQHPCPGDIEYYSIENDRGYSAFVWEVPRAQSGSQPAGWEILGGQGTRRVKVRVGEKSGTMKVKVTDSRCGTKVATLPVKPGKDFEVTISGPNNICVDELQEYRATVSRKGNGQGHKPGEFIYTWTVPAGWVILAGNNTDKIKVWPGSTDGEVSVTVKDNAVVSGNGNNGVGVGGYKAGYCGVAADGLLVVTREDCGTGSCPVPTVTVSGPDKVCAFQDELVTYKANTTNTNDKSTFTWALPEGWAIESGEGSPEIQVIVGSEPGEVSVTVANACGTQATDAQAVAVDEECGEVTPLPVELISFEGEATKSGVLLEWETATEKNNDRFEIERSANGRDFDKIGEVKGNGTTTGKRTYSLRDAKVTRGTHYYRLKQVDLDGKFEYSQLIVVDYNPAPMTANLVVAPNPAAGQFSVALGAAEGAQLQILDMNGNLLYRQEISPGAQELSFDTARLGMRQGMYLISVKSGGGASHAKLVVR